MGVELAVAVVLQDQRLAGAQPLDPAGEVEPRALQELGVAVEPERAQLVEGGIHLDVFQGLEDHGRAAVRGRVLDLEALLHHPLAPLLGLEQQHRRGGGRRRRAGVEHGGQPADALPLRGGAQEPLVGVGVQVLGQDVRGAGEGAHDLPGEVAARPLILPEQAAGALALGLGARRHGRPERPGVGALAGPGETAAEVGEQAVERLAAVGVGGGIGRIGPDLAPPVEAAAASGSLDRLRPSRAGSGRAVRGAAPPGAWRHCRPRSGSA